MQTVLIAIAAYCLGSISFAVFISKAMGLPDPRSYGSKNPGATRFTRTGASSSASVAMSEK